MATATQSKMNAADVLPDIMEMLGGISERDLALFREKLQKRQVVTQQSEYHRTILARVFPQPGVPTPDLPGGKYESYELRHGKHYQTKNSTLLAARKEHKAKCDEAERLGHQMPEFPNIQAHEFHAGNTVTPETDGEALLMLQDPDKYRPLRGGDQDRIAHLLAEQEAMKQGYDASAAAKDAEIEKLQRELAEVKKQRPNGK